MIWKMIVRTPSRKIYQLDADESPRGAEEVVYKGGYAHRELQPFKNLKEISKGSAKLHPFHRIYFNARNSRFNRFFGMCPKHVSFK